MGEEDCPEGTGDGPEQLAGATGATGTGFEVGEVAGEVVALDDVEHECFGLGHGYVDATAVKSAAFLGDGSRSS